MAANPCQLKTHVMTPMHCQDVAFLKPEKKDKNHPAVVYQCGSSCHEPCTLHSGLDFELYPERTVRRERKTSLDSDLGLGRYPVGTVRIH